MASLLSQRLHNRQPLRKQQGKSQFGRGAEQLKEGLNRFQNILAIRDRLSRRIGRRLTFLTRFTMISLAAIVIAFILLISVMSAKVATMAKSLDSIEHDYAAVSNNIARMNHDFHQVELHLDHFSVMNQVLVQIDDHTKILTSNMGKLDHNLANITHSMYGMQATAQALDHALYQMDSHVYQLQYDVGKTARPVRIFNQIMGR